MCDPIILFVKHDRTGIVGAEPEIALAILEDGSYCDRIPIHRVVLLEREAKEPSSSPLQNTDTAIEMADPDIAFLVIPERQDGLTLDGIGIFSIR